MEASFDITSMSIASSHHGCIAPYVYLEQPLGSGARPQIAVVNSQRRIDGTPLGERKGAGLLRQLDHGDPSNAPNLVR